MNPLTEMSSALTLRRMYGTLVEAYGPQHWWPGETQLEIIVGAYLTQNTSWRGVELSIANLRKDKRLTLQGLRDISEEDLRLLINPSGFMQRKAAAIKAFIAFLDKKYSGSLKQLAVQETSVARQQLLALPGVGPETADAILLYALGHPAMVVDEYLRRIVTRHALIQRDAKYNEIQQLAVEAFDDDAPSTHTQHYNEFHAVIVETGKRHCRREPQCDHCPLFQAGFHPAAKPYRLTATRK